MSAIYNHARLLRQVFPRIVQRPGSGSPAIPHARAKVAHRMSRPGLQPQPFRPGDLGAGHWGLSVLLAGLMAFGGQTWAATVCQYPTPPSCTNPPLGWPDDIGGPGWKGTHVWDDSSTDTTGSLHHLNFVGDANNYGFYTAEIADGGTYGQYLYFRMRVNYTGASFPTGNGQGALFLLIQNTVSGSPQTPAPNWGIAWDIVNADNTKHGMEFQHLGSTGSGPPAQTWTTTTMDDIDNTNNSKLAPDIDSCTPARTTDGYIRTVTQVAGVAPLTTTAFVDFAISCNYLSWASTWASGGACVNGGGQQISPDLLCGGKWFLQLASAGVNNDHQPLDYDVAPLSANVNTAPLPTVPSVLTRPGGTYALLNTFGATVEGHQVIIVWDTQTEVNTLGFDLERQSANGQFERVNPALIAARGLPSGKGGAYRLSDPSALPDMTYRYRLTELETNGNRRMLGEFTVKPMPGENMAEPLTGLHPGSVAAHPDGEGSHRVMARLAERARERTSAASGFRKGTSPAEIPDKLAISIDQAGLYRMGESELLTLGWPKGRMRTLLQNQQFRLTRQGHDIAWLPAPGGKELIFYGEPTDSRYDAQSVYVLEIGPGRVMSGVKGPGRSPLAPATTFPATVVAEENRIAATARAQDPEQDYWYSTAFKAGGPACQQEFSACGSREFVIDATDAAAAGSARLTLYLSGASALLAGPDHHATVTLNGTPIGGGQWEGLQDHALVLPFEQTLLRPDGRNTVRVEAQRMEGVEGNVFYLDRFELTYQRHYRAAGNSLRATGGPEAPMEVTGFSSPAIQAFDLSDPHLPQLISGVHIRRAGKRFTARLTPASRSTPYLLAADTAIKAPPSVRVLRSTGLAGNNAGAEYVMIAPEAFRDAGLKLVEFRRSQGLSAQFVSLEAIYDEYGGGQKTPQAIRQFLLEAAKSWKQPPRYVVLGGKGTYDPKDYLGTGTDRLPVLMTHTPAGLIAADQNFVDGDGNGVGDIAIGRLPAVTAGEFTVLVDKIIGYETALVPGSGRVVMLADGPDGNGDYTADSQSVGALAAQAGYAIEPIYLEKLYAQYPSEAEAHAVARTRLLSELEAGPALVNYFGHAGVLSLDHGLLRAADAGLLNNQQGLSLMTGMTCFMSRFELPQYTSLAETLLLQPGGGMAGVWSSGGMSYNHQASQLDAAFFRALFQSGQQRVGDAIVLAATEYLAAGNGADLLGIYNYLGDPASAWNH